ncbi:cell division protein ZapA [Candidatus Vallotia tarda]|uniref:Cell division protein ZapA n=1 Tax=Candidatus Vallotiella hemipterorum TaxID=1177213 RepID=A0A916NUV0_9BURK|nr:cell division protein ZapA [Candidatus Vallotia tarda]CAG7600560.1 Cell division protein ZapA [Candidatus Vallotia tarda]
MTTKQIEVSILGQSYRLSTLPENEPELLEAAKRVDREMNKVRAASNVRSYDRIAVMAALSIASELLQLNKLVQDGERHPVVEIQHTIAQINNKLAEALRQNNAEKE